MDIDLTYPFFITVCFFVALAVLSTYLNNHFK